MMAASPSWGRTSVLLGRASYYNSLFDVLIKHKVFPMLFTHSACPPFFFHRSQMAEGIFLIRRRHMHCSVSSGVGLWDTPRFLLRAGPLPLQPPPPHVV